MSLNHINLVATVILILAVLRLVSQAFKFEKIGRLEHVIIPAYALVMFLGNMTWNLPNMLIAVGLGVISVLIAWYQVSQVQIRVTSETDQHHRPVVLVRKGATYLMGWVLLVIAEIVCSAFTEAISSSQIMHSIASDIKSEVFLLANFSGHHSWYIWMLTGTTAYAYTQFLQHKDASIEQALRRKHKLH